MKKIILRRGEQKRYMEMDEIIDTETGVHYFIEANASGVKLICPRYMSNGLLVTSSEEEIKKMRLEIEALSVKKYTNI